MESDVRRAAGTGEDGEEGADGWDLVQRPGGGWSTLKAADAGTEGPGMSTFILPPPPSQPELVGSSHLHPSCRRSVAKKSNMDRPLQGLPCERTRELLLAQQQARTDFLCSSMPDSSSATPNWNLLISM